MKRLVMVLALCACDPIDVVVASIADGGLDCNNSMQCAPGSFCDKPGCTATWGTCVQRTMSLDNRYEPVCGCDDVTYLNPALLRQSGMSLRNTGECTQGVTCDAQQHCPERAFCAHIDPEGSCTMQHGRCWRVPPTSCPAAPGRFTSCQNGTCVDFCEAVRAPDVFTPTASGTCP